MNGTPPLKEIESVMAQARTFPVRTWQDVIKMKETRRFLIDGLVCDTSTLLLGEPKAGKSYLAAGIVGSLLTGEPFLGRQVLFPQEERRIAICWTDDNAEAEYRDRLLSILPKGIAPPVRFYNVPEIDGKGWGELHREIESDGCNLVVFDVMNQALRGSANEDHVITDFFRGVRQCTRNGIPTLVIAHSSEKSNQYGAKSRTPMGSTQISGAVRWISSLSRSESGVWSLRTKGAVGDNAELQFTAPEFDVPRFEIMKEVCGVEKRRRSRERSVGTMDRNQEIARWSVANCQGLNQKETAEKISEKWPELAVSTCKSSLSGGRGFGALLRQEGTAWMLSGPLRAAA